MRRKICMMFESLHCYKATPGRGYDEIYFKIWINDVFYSTYPKDIRHGDVFKMNEDEANRKMDLDFTVSYDDTLTIQLMEQDSQKHPDRDDNMGHMYLHVSDFGLGSTSIHEFQFSSAEQGHCVYGFKYRMISQKLPVLRILGLHCQKSSCGCNKQLADTLFDTTSSILEISGKICGLVKNPEAELVAEALEAAAMFVEGVKYIYEWMADAIEGYCPLSKELDRMAWYNPLCYLG